MRAQSDFYQAMGSCGKGNLSCRLNRVKAFGFKGIYSSFQKSLKPLPKPRTPACSEGIERAICKFLEHFLMGKIKDIFKGHWDRYEKLFKVAYYPHYQLLKAAEGAQARYWARIPFLRWSLWMLQELCEQIPRYCRVTGVHEQKVALVHMAELTRKADSGQISEDELSDEYLRFRDVAKILVDFDRLLIADLNELFSFINSGLEQVLEFKTQENNIDDITLKAIQKELKLFWLGFRGKLAAVVDKLYEHGHGWDWRNYPPQLPHNHQELRNEVTQLSRNLQRAIESMDSKTT